MSSIDDQSIRDKAREIILEHAQDIEYMSIGEMMDGDPVFEGLTEDEFDAEQDRIDKQIRNATVTVRLPGEPWIVCLSGSTRFRTEFEETNRQLTMAGQIVLSVGVYGHADGIEITDTEKAALDALHLAKINLADEVLIINPGGYIGASTANEIAYATKVGKPVRYLEDPK